MKERLLELIAEWRTHKPKRNATTHELKVQFGRDLQFQECADQLEAILKEPEIVPHANEPCSWDDPPYCETHGGYAPNGWHGVGEGEPCSKIKPDV